MPSYRKKPDRLEGVARAASPMLLGTARQAVISAQTQVKVAGPVYHGCQMVAAAIDALAKLITGPAGTFMRRGRSARPANLIGFGIGRVRSKGMRPLRSSPDHFEIWARAICRSCGKARDLGPDELLGAADMDAFKELEHRFRCSGCGERAVSVEPIWHKDWASAWTRSTPR